jgi:diguanylate cyclase (GGDEF)-like protein
VARGGGNGAGNGGSRQGTPAAILAREVSALQATLLERLRAEMPNDDVEGFADAAVGLAEAFGSVTAAAVEPVSRRIPPFEELASLYRPGHMRRRLDQLIEAHRRYGHPFGLVVFDVDGPGARDDGAGGPEEALTVVDAALRDGVRLVDEAFRLEEDALCVLAPNQDTVGGVQMSERLLGVLGELEAAGGLPIGISAGVVACPEHGTEADDLLRKADEAMWRARAVGQPVGVGVLDVA